MNSELATILIGLAAGLITAGALVLFWMRPGLAAAQRRIEQESEVKVNAALLDAKEEALKLRERMEDEFRQKQATLAKQEEKLEARDDALEARRTSLADREDRLSAEQRSLAARNDEVTAREQSINTEIQKIAALSQDDARDLLLSRIESEFHEIGQRKAKEVEAAAVADAQQRARRIVLDAMQHSLVEYVTEATSAVVELPSEDIKGRIIGREGRNIRAFEQVTGVDLIIDETPEAVVISSFDPARREVARLTLMNLMVDGRIHPGRIEELYEKALAEVDRTIQEAGERAVEQANVPGLAPKVIETLGRLRFRTSYAQNVLDHSVEVSRLAANLAAELGLNAEVAKRAGLLHDIGKALGPEWEGPHALTGMEFLRNAGEKDAVTHAVGAHHYEIDPASPEAILVIIADTISAARPGARRENLENYLKRLSSLEQLANSFPGVDRSYAVQAGREIRLIVKPTEVDDLAAARLAEQVARRIESEMEYPGQIKVTVIRETRVQDVAK